MRNEKPCACLSISTGVRARRSASTKCRDRKWEKMRNGKGNQLSQFHAKVSLLFTGFITFGWNGNSGPLVIQYRSNQLLLMTLRLVKVANWIAIKRPIIHCHNSMKFRLNLDGGVVFKRMIYRWAIISQQRQWNKVRPMARFPQLRRQTTTRQRWNVRWFICRQVSTVSPLGLKFNKVAQLTITMNRVIFH